MRALHRKLLRDLLGFKGQVAAIAVVIAAGVMVLIIGATTLDAVRQAQQAFYQSHQFAEVFSELKRAPESLGEVLGGIAGVNLVETRVQAPVRLEIAGFDDPVRGLVLSVPEGRQPLVNRLAVRAGSLPKPGHDYQAAISEPLAEAHGLRPGDSLRAIINGRLETLTISGVVLSPEFVYQVGPADLLPDYERYGVLWMGRRALGRAFDMDGAFNSVVLTLQAGADERGVIEALDDLLAPYGSVGAYGRADQPSHFFIKEEIAQLRVMGTLLPAVFLGVAAFLLHVLMARVVRTQRQQVAILKAFGYGKGAIALHYLLFTAVIVVLGAVLGMTLGAWAAEGLAGLYAEYFRFPEMHFRVAPRVIALALLIAAGAALSGTWQAVRGAAAQQPASAMRPPTPERFARGRCEGALLRRLLDQPSRIILRNLARHPIKSGLSVLGIALSVALLLLGSYQFGSVTRLMEIQYGKVLRMDQHLIFTEPTSEGALAELRALPGVLYVEPYRSVPVRLRKGVREYRTSIYGLESRPRLRQVLDARHAPVTVPEEGLLLTSYLAEYLGVHPGETLRVEIMEGRRRTLDLTLAATVEEPVGVSAYMERRTLNRLLGEGPAMSGAWLLTDAHREAALFERLWEMPRIAGIGMISQAEAHLRDYLDSTMLMFMGILLLLAASIAFAVVYNNARITLAERERELATLRVLGFSRGEVAWILVGEIILLTLGAIPLGWLLGSGLAWLVNQAISADMFRLPFVLEPSIYAFSAAGVVLAALLSVGLMARRLARIDMVSSLKTE
ncbi:ABC transporter permease [Geoalkalibacter halelectricus]|uniref:ABC transporter permease n=1 Tax=Geoalkalibacter halelectricus TaxID=2847045 RepID=UPI003D2078EE